MVNSVAVMLCNTFEFNAFTNPLRVSSESFKHDACIGQYMRVNPLNRRLALWTYIP